MMPKVVPQYHRVLIIHETPT